MKSDLKIFFFLGLCVGVMTTFIICYTMITHYEKDLCSSKIKDVKTSCDGQIKSIKTRLGEIK